MDLQEKTKENINNLCKRNFNMSYEDYSNLPEKEQRALIKRYHKKHKLYKNKEILVMIGSGEHAIFRRVKKGTKVFITSGDDSFFTRAGLSLEESRRVFDDRFDDLFYPKPVAFVKKLVRRIKK